MWAFAWEKKKSEKEDDRLYRHFTGIKFHLKSFFLFNLNKTLNCLAAHLVSLNSCFLSHLLPCTRFRSCAHTTGSNQAAVYVCFYIAAIFHFGLLSLNCLWGFVWREEPPRSYMRLRGKETEVRDLFMFLLIFVASTPSHCCFFPLCCFASCVSLALNALCMPLPKHALQSRFNCC